MMDFTLAETQQAVAGLAAQVLAGADPWKELAQAGLLRTRRARDRGAPDRDRQARLAGFG